MLGELTSVYRIMIDVLGPLKQQTLAFIIQIAKTFVCYLDSGLNGRPFGYQTGLNHLNNG